MRTKLNQKSKVIPEPTPELPNNKPKRREIGDCDGHKLFQLEEQVGCLDCFRSLPAGSIIALQHVSTDMCKVPVCMYFAGLDPSNISLTSKVEKSCSCSCSAFVDGAKVPATSRPRPPLAPLPFRSGGHLAADVADHQHLLL